MIKTFFSSEHTPLRPARIIDGHYIITGNCLPAKEFNHRRLLRGPRRQKINSCLGILLTSFASFFEKGFDIYLQHFVMMVWWSARRICPYIISIFDFQMLCLGRGFLPFSIQLRATFYQNLLIFSFLKSTISGLAKEGQIEPHRRPPSSPAMASKTSAAGGRCHPTESRAQSPEPGIIHPIS